MSLEERCCIPTGWLDWPSIQGKYYLVDGHNDAKFKLPFKSNAAIVFRITVRYCKWNRELLLWYFYSNPEYGWNPCVNLLNSKEVYIRFQRAFHHDTTSAMVLKSLAEPSLFVLPLSQLLPTETQKLNLTQSTLFVISTMCHLQIHPVSSIHYRVWSS